MGALAVVPLHADAAPPPFGYLTLAEAYAEGQVTVTEKNLASVNTLSLTNRGWLPILVLDGEEIIGGRQNRVVNTTLLVPSRVRV